MNKTTSSKHASPSPSERRQIENEAVFRKANEKIQKDLDEISAVAKSEGNESLIPTEDLTLHFYCECSDENCRERIVLSHSKYKELHRDRKHFIVVPGHEVSPLETVISKETKYNLVDKFFNPPENVTNLNPTSVNNT